MMMMMMMAISEPRLMHLSRRAFMHPFICIRVHMNATRARAALTDGGGEKRLEPLNATPGVTVMMNADWI